MPTYRSPLMSPNHSMDVLEELKVALEDLQEVLHCPVCLDIFKPPIIECFNGHGICSGCKKNQNKCPTCKEQFLNKSSTLLKQVIEALPKPCKYKLNGCAETFNIFDHEIFCEFRTLECKICDWSGPLTHLKNHFQLTHTGYTSEENITNLSFDVVENYNGLTNTNFLCVVEEDGPNESSPCMFWLHIYRNHELFIRAYSLEIIPTPSNVRDPVKYFATFSFQKHNIRFASTVAVPFSNENKAFTENKFLFAIPRNMILFCNEETIDGKVEIFMLKNP